MLTKPVGLGTVAAMYAAALPPWTFPRSTPNTYALLDVPPPHPGGNVAVRCDVLGALALSTEHAPAAIENAIANASQVL